MQNKSTYWLDADSYLEASRLVNQERFVTEAVGLFPRDIDTRALHTVLDIGCGPGGWLLDLAAEYPHMHGHGIDVSEPMLCHARLLSGAENVPLSFTWMDARHGLAFPDNTFDFIQMRLSSSFLLPAMWLPLLKECVRVLRPKGYLRIVELELVLTNKPETEAYHQMLPDTWKKAGFSFSPTGRSMGLLVELKSLIHKAGLTDQQICLHPLDVSSGTKHYQVAVENLKVIFAGTRETLIRVNGYAQEELLARYHRALQVMQQEDYTCMVLLFSNCAQKPEETISPNEKAA